MILSGSLTLELDMKKSLSNWGIVELDPQDGLPQNKRKKLSRETVVCNHIIVYNETEGLEVDARKPR